MKNLEIAWREELIKRLQAPLNTLNRKYEAEQLQRNNRLKELETYSSVEDAQEAYGYGNITLEEYDFICGSLKEHEKEHENIVTPISAAREELLSIISKYEKDIRYFKWEALSDEEKEAIEQKNADYKQKLKYKLR